MLLLLNDLSRAVRGLRKSPALAAAAIVSLALGIGPNVTVFSVVREIILDDLSAHQLDRLARVEGLEVSYARYRELRVDGPFQDLAFYRGLGDRIWQEGRQAEIVWTVVTSPNFFDVLGVGASAGRLYSRGDEGREIAVVSRGFWRKRLQAKLSALGEPLRLNGRLYTIAGILPEDYRSVYGHGVSPEIYLSDPGNSKPDDRIHYLFGRLRDGVSREQTRQALTLTVERTGGRELAQTISAVRPMGGLAAYASGNGQDRSFFLFFIALFGLAGMLTLIACCNVAGLLVARAHSRQRDLAIRNAMGANHFQLARPLFVDGFVLIVLGGATGFVLDAIVRARLRSIVWPSAYGLPFAFHFQNDSALLLYASLSVFVALLLSSLLPAILGAQTDLSIAMKQQEASLSVRRWDLRSAFVLLQVVLSMALLAVGGMFTAGLMHLVGSGPGFDVDHTLIATMHRLPLALAGKTRQELRQQVMRTTKAIPGVVSVTSTNVLPLMGELPSTRIRDAAAPLSPARSVYVIGAGETYCGTLGIGILQGRDIEIADRYRKPAPVVVNLTLSQQVFGNANPLGKYLTMGQDKVELLEIVGVSADSRMRTLGEGNMPALFKPDFNSQLLVRVVGAPVQWIAPLRKAFAEIDDTAALDVRPLKDAVAGAIFPMRAAAWFLGGLSGLGLVLTLVGLYGSVSYSVGRRERDFGIRTALGAPRGRLVWTALRGGLLVLACGVLIGVPLAVSVMRPLVELLPAGVNPWGPIPFFLAVLSLFGTGFFAAWLPARRAASLDPARLLRQQ